MRISDWSSDVCSSDLACGNARANPVASQTDCRLNVVAESDGDNGDAGADDGQDEGVLGRGRAALVLPKPLKEITHRFSPFLCWFPDPPPDVSWRAGAASTGPGYALLPATDYLPPANGGNGNGTRRTPIH